MIDEVELIGKGTLIQHGKHNDRIYLMKLNGENVEQVINTLQQLAHKNNYGKIFCKVPKKAAPLFFAHGYLMESCIPKFYNNKEDVFFLSKFLCADRMLHVEKEKLSDLSELLTDQPKNKPNASDYKIRRLSKKDVNQITKLFRQVFESYPFPIHQEDYILETMDDNVQYYGAEMNGQIAALASSEIDQSGQNAEMTDFATHHDHQGKNLSTLLLNVMEKDMKKQGITTLHTIARLNSIPMNKTFIRADYKYSGTLIKNTNISGKIESMNIYYKHI